MAKSSPEGLTADLTGEPRTARRRPRSALVLLRQIGAGFPFGLLRLAKDLFFVARGLGNASVLVALWSSSSVTEIRLPKHEGVDRHFSDARAGAVYVGYVGWNLTDVEMPLTGWVAMGLDIFFSLALGAGLMGLMFYSSRHGYDEPPSKPPRSWSLRDSEHFPPS